MDSGSTKIDREKHESTDYEYDRIADRKRVDFIVTVLKKSIPPGGRILDVGCGNGVISRHLGKYGFEVLGIDVSEKTIEKARSLTHQTNVTFLQKSAEELIASGAHYDAVICSEVLEHLSHPEMLLKVLYQSLEKGGKLIVTVPNGNGPRESLVTRPMLRLRRSNGFLWRSVNQVKKALGYRGTTVQSEADNLDHIQFFSKKDLENLSRANGFRITSFGKANFVEDVFPFSVFAKRMPVFQKLDCKIADLLPVQFTGGFFSVWEKNDHEQA